MRTALAAVLACLFVVMTTADRLACPDGCTDDAPAQTATPLPSSPCAFCLGWSHSPSVVASRPLPRVIARLPVITLNPTAPALPTFEPPPKAA